MQNASTVHITFDGQPYCLMGVCFECLMEIDGEPDVQSCLVTVREGMVVRRQLPGEAE